MLLAGGGMTDQTKRSETTAVSDAWTVRRVLEWTTGHLQKHGSETPRLDAEILLAFSRECPRIKLYTEYDEVLSDAVRAKMKSLVQRRAAREPVAYLVGYREFFSLPFRVTSDVLIPRPDTETLVMEALEVVKPLAAATVVDLCTGSGCVAVSLAKNAPASQVTATDISPAALEVAAANAAANGVESRVTFVKGDLLTALPAGTQFDVIVSNPPYIRTDELKTLDADVREFEPQLALDGGADGLDLVRRIFSGIRQSLKSGGWLLLEIDPSQFPVVNQLAEQQGTFTNVASIKDLNGNLRVWRGQLA